MDGRNLRVCLVAAAGWAGLSQPVAPRPAVHRHLAQLNGIKNQRMVRGQCAGAGAGCLLNSKPQETFGPILGAPPAPAHTSPAQSINTLPIWTVSFSNHISQTWPSPQQMRRSANNSWAQRNDEMKTIVCTLRGDEEDEDGPWSWWYHRDNNLTVQTSVYSHLQPEALYTNHIQRCLIKTYKSFYTQQCFQTSIDSKYLEWAMRTPGILPMHIT